MATTYRLQLGVAMLSPEETELVLASVGRCWQRPCFVNKQTNGGVVTLLSMHHEEYLKPDESPDWFIERLAASIWSALGRYTRISMDIAPHEAPDGKLYIFDEDAYRSIMHRFRFSHPVQR